MKLVRRLDDLPPQARGGAVSIGNFDGVHRGHARIVERLRAQAAAVGGPAVAFTFEPHPARLLRPEAAPPPLTPPERKAELLAALGVDVLVAYPTDAELLGLTPENFFRRIVTERLAARAVVEGPNFRFGRNRAGDVDLLGMLCAAAGVTLELVPPLLIEGEYVSSSRIRDLVARGETASAAELLGRPYAVRGRVVRGTERGRTLGFPTANLADLGSLAPAPGVYAGRTRIGGRTYAAAVNLGGNPTFGEQGLKLEAHLLDFAGDLYGIELELEFLARLRDVRTFPGVETLLAQLREDVAAARRAAEEAG